MVREIHQGEKAMKYFSCFSGIEAATIAAHHLGWQCVGLAEIEKFPAAVLAHRFPDVPNHGDVMADDFIQKVIDSGANFLVGGPPEIQGAGK